MKEGVKKARDSWIVEVEETPCSFGTCHCMVYLRHKQSNIMVMLGACRSGQERLSFLCDRRPRLLEVIEQIETDLNLPEDQFRRKYSISELACK
ncbi:MAG: hypothetical protein ACUVTZ_09405 [Armatimonadota bacterium]